MKNIVIAIMFLVSIKVHAQDTIVLSLPQSYELGLKNRFDAQANKINVDLANNTVEKSKKEWLPDINATGDIRYNTQLQTMVFPDGFGNGVSTVITMGTKNNTLFALDLTQPIYKPGINTDIKIAKNNALLEQEKNREKNISIKQSIAQAYLNVILKEVQWKSADEVTKRNAEYYSLAEEKYKLGVLLENDYLKSQLDYENAKHSELKTKQNYDLAMMQLKFQLNIDNATTLILSDSIESIQNQEALIEADNVERTELKQLDLQYKSNELNLKKSQYYFLPTISLTANYSTQFQAETFDYKRNEWSPFNYVGVKFSLPITGNIKNRNTKNEYRLKMTQTELNLKQKQQEISIEILQYKTELENAEKSIIESKNNLLLSKKVHQSQLNTYRLGTASYSSLLDTESSLETSEQNYIEAVYNFLLARINYEKAIGKL